MSKPVPQRILRPVLLLLAIAILAVLSVRWYTTSSRRDAYDRLARLPCALIPGFMGGFHNPHDFLSIRGDSVIGDVIRPPRITALEIREPLTPDQKADVAGDVLAFPELEYVVLWPGSSVDDAETWRSQLPPHIRISHRDSRLGNDRHSRQSEDKTIH